MTESQVDKTRTPFKTVFSPDHPYDTLDPNKEGQWTEITVGEDNIGILWTDGDRGAGYLPKNVNSHRDISDKLTTMFLIGAQIDIPAQMMYSHAVSSLEEGEDTVSLFAQEGTLADATVGMVAEESEDPITAAVDPELEEQEDLFTGEVGEYSLVVEDGKVVALLRMTDEAPFIRENGTWKVVTDPDDDIVWNSIYYEVTADAVEKYDKLEGSNSTPQDYKEVYLD